MQIRNRNSRDRILDRLQAAVSALRESVRPGRAVADDKPRCLAILREGLDREVLRDVFRAAGWELAVADTVSSALPRQKNRPIPLIFCDRELPEGNWQRAVSMLANLPGRPWVILVSNRCDQNLWDSLTLVGGSDILRAPLDRDAVIRAVRSGWLLWRHLQEITPLRTA